jgi:hypothetical protein
LKKKTPTEALILLSKMNLRGQKKPGDPSFFFARAKKNGKIFDPEGEFLTGGNEGNGGNRGYEGKMVKSSREG